MNTDEMDEEELADRCCDQPSRHCAADKEIEDALRQIDAEDAAAKSILESPVWKDPQFLTKLAREIPNKEAVGQYVAKHYVDNAGQPARAPNISKMGSPKRGADGRVLRDARGQVIWDTSAEQQFNPADVNRAPARANVMADGHIDLTKSIMGNPVRQADGSIKWQ
jgi:hypothetical protein